MTEISRLERVVLDARRTLEAPGMEAQRTRSMSGIALLSTGVRVHERHSTQWVDIGEHPSNLNMKRPNLRRYSRLVEHTEWDGKRRLFMPTGLLDLALASKAEEPDEGQISVEHGFGPISLRGPSVMTDSIDIGVAEIDGVEVALGDDSSFRAALEDLNEIAQSQGLLDLPR